MEYFSSGFLPLYVVGICSFNRIQPGRLSGFQKSVSDVYIVYFIVGEVSQVFKGFLWWFGNGISFVVGGF